MLLKSRLSVPARLSRRQLLTGGARGVAYLALAKALSACGGSDFAGDGASGAKGRLGNLGPLGEPLDIGIRIPEGFTARVLAEANRVVPNTNLLWHTDPDGGATYKTEDGGWIYVSNREFLPGGVNALRFNSEGEVVDGYNILAGLFSSINCGGGISPWNTWFSGEEHLLGHIWECDPFGKERAQMLGALGTFKHEAAAVDPRTNYVYETEDESDGRFYRFIPDTPNVGGRADLRSGKLQVMQVQIPQEEVNVPGLLGPVAVQWLDVPRPNPFLGGVLTGNPTRTQVPASTAFRGGEGIWYHDGVIYFSTKGDRRIWAHDTARQTLECIYDDDLFPEPILDSVDNIVVTPGGDLVIVEDKSEANQQAVAIAADGRIFPLIELAGQEGSEVTGPAFSPDGRHFYFSSQRGPKANGVTGFAGITYVVSGPWFSP